MEDSNQPDLSHLIGLIGDQGESLALNFDSIDADAPVIASVGSVKPVIVDWNDFNLDSIILPENINVTETDTTATDLNDLMGLLGDQGESLALDFDAFDADAPVSASVGSVKPVLVDWISQTDPFIDSDWTPIIEELFYTTELG